MAAGDQNSPVTDFTSLDYPSVLADLTRFAQSVCGVNLTDLNPSDPAVMIVQCLAYCTDLLGYNWNQTFKEFVAMLALRKTNFENVAKMLGWKSKRPTPSTGALTFVVDLDAAGGSITISKHFQVSLKSDPTVIFQPDTDTTLVGTGTQTVTVNGTQGEEHAGEAVAVSTGRALQKYALAQAHLLESTLVLTVGAVQWTPTDFLALAAPTDKVFSISYDQDDVAWITFGDGINGLVPAFGAAIVATYKTGGGSAGNADVGAISKLVTTQTGVKSVTNAARWEGGDEAQTLQSAQASLPGFVRANDRAVNEDDYAAEVVSVSGIEKAIASSGKSAAGGCGKPVIIRAIPSGGGSLTPTLIGNAQTLLKSKKMSGKRTIVKDADYAQLAITVVVRVLTGASAENVKTIVENLIADRYDRATVNFGDRFDVQELYQMLLPTKVRGVQGVLVERFTVLAHAGTYDEFPTTGNGVVNYIESTANRRREWQIVVTTGGNATIPGAFNVLERFVGFISDLSDVTLGDEFAEFPTPNGFVGGNWYVRLNPYDEGSVAVLVVGNTVSAVTVDGTDLRTSGGVGDPYIVEHTQTSTGVIYQRTFAGPVAGGAPTIALPGTWATGQKVRISDTGGVVFETTITGGTSGAYTISPVTPAGGLSGTVTVDAMWVSDDGTLKFVLSQGSVFWTPGDTIYVDTYADVGDIVLRRENFPQLNETNLALRTIGGRA